MRRAEGVVVALRALGEARQPAALAQRADAVAPPGEDLVRVGLVPDVPDHPVARRVEHGMQRHRQFHHAEPSPQMPARHRDRVDRLRTQLVGHQPKLGIGQAAQIGGSVDRVEERGVEGHGELHPAGTLSIR